MMDSSEVRQIIGGTLHMGAVFDAFSRCPLVLEVFDRKPTGKDMAGLLRRAARASRIPGTSSPSSEENSERGSLPPL
jgi:hypothetical protein